jgi:hypothetical protein
MAVAATGALRVVNPATLELVGTVTTTDPVAAQARRLDGVATDHR